MSRTALLTPAGVAVAAAGLPAPAMATWTPARAVPGSGAGTIVQPVLAVDGRGDVATAWIDDGGGSNGVRHPVVSVRAAVRRSGGRFVTHTLVRHRDLAVQGLTVALDRRGELTVAWIDHPGQGGHQTVRAAYRTPGGAWSRVQAVGFSSAFFSAFPRLAVAPDRRVLLSYAAGVRRAPGVGVAWRTPGRPFGALQGVGRLPIFSPVPAFDGDNRAYLSGIASCDNESASRGVLRVTAPNGRRFGAPRTVAPAPSTELSVRITGAGTAVAAWVGAGCSTSELLSGPIMGAVVRGGTVGRPQVIHAAPARGVLMSGALGGAEASWTAFLPSAPEGAVFHARLGAGGVFGPAAPPADGWVAAAADAAGDQVTQTRMAENTGPPGAVGARGAGSDAVEPAPLPGPQWFGAAGSGPDGRALAADAIAGGKLRVAVWTPAA